jgi:hypothetical protein
MQEILDTSKETLGGALNYAIVAVLVLVLGYILLKILKRRTRRRPTREPDLAIDVSLLGEEGPPAAGPTLEFYNLPVRLAAVVFAPTGRVAELPTLDKVPALIDHVVPGLAEVAFAQTPLIRCWPSQLSGEGFAHMFFAHVRLPGDRGKGTPWCSAAGRFKIGNKAYMAGLLMRADRNNNFSETIIGKEHEWLGIMRVRGG